MLRKPVDTAHEVQRAAARRDQLLEALRTLYDETQDWEDALGEERPSLREARAKAAKVLGGR